MAMEYRFMGRTGLKLSALSFGAWVTFGVQVDVEAAKGLIQLCVDKGVNFFDNAEVYAGGKAEEVMGQAIQELGLKRKDLVLSTKIFWGGQGPNDRGLSRKHIIEGTLAALRRLRTEYVDLIFCHRPDPFTPIEETVRAMNFVLDKGWAFYWGTSEWSAQQITQAHECARRLNLVGPAMEQPEYNLFERQKVEVDYAPIYKEYGLGLTTWSPLASGVLTGKYSSGNPPPDGTRLAMADYKFIADKKLQAGVLDKVELLRPISEKLGCSLAQLSIAWCVKNADVTTVILGASKKSQLEENLQAMDIVPKLTPEVIAELDAIFPKPEGPRAWRS